jgi:hypothetical protein
MIGVLTISIMLILLTFYFFVFCWTFEPFSRKKQQERSWVKEAPLSEELLKRFSTEASAGRLWINVYVIKIRQGLSVPAVRYPVFTPAFTLSFWLPRAFDLDVGLVGALPKTVGNCRFFCGLSLSVLLAACLESPDPKRFWICLILLVAMRPKSCNK